MSNPFGPPIYFPDVTELCDSEGAELDLIGIGGKLDPDWLCDAYTHGLFPWPTGSYRHFRAEDYPRQARPGAWDMRLNRTVYDIMDPEEPMHWWSPNPRGIFEPGRFHVPQRLKRTLSSGKFTVTFNQDFHNVMLACAIGPDRIGRTWITPALFEAFLLLHRLGIAHSVETWHSGKLVGGAYGVAFHGLFAAESMFHRVTDASKVALIRLLERLTDNGFALIDIQMLTEHTERLGAIEIPRSEYMRRLHDALRRDTVRF